MNRTVLTGASGFLGGHVAAALLRGGGEVTALLRGSSSLRNVPSECRVERVDFMDPRSMKGFLSGAGMIVHSAGATGAASREAFDRANALVTRNMLTARDMYAPDALFVHVSSQAAAGPSGCGPVTAYGRSKLLSELPVRESENWVIIRPPAIFGPGDPASAPVMRMALRGLFISPWTNRGGFCLVYVEDLAGLIASLPDHSRAPGRTLEPSYGKLFSWKDFHGILQRAAERRILHLRIPPPLVRTAGFMNEVFSSMAGREPFFCRDKCRELLAREWDLDDGLTERITGWKPAVPVEEGMRRTFEWIREGCRGQAYLL